MAPTDFYSRLKSKILGEKEGPVKPPMDTNLAVGLLLVYTLIYVVPFYLSSTTRPSANLSRDAPSVIRGRIASVTTSCTICSIATFVILCTIVKDGTFGAAFHAMGWYPIGILETVKAVGLTAVLFLGPLFEAGIVQGGWRDWIRLRGLSMLSGWMGYRNIVAGPVTEEILFRSASVPLLLLSQTSNKTIIFLTPIIFGLAHVHHFYEFRITHPHTPVTAAFLRSLLQFTYTTLFGGYATFLYLRTGSLLAVILVHAFCNWMGFPRFWGRLTYDADTVIGPDVGDKKSEDAKQSVNDGSLGVGWTIVYYILLVVGAVGWKKLLWQWTASPSALTTFP
ncbi:hypothetical protein GLAREA_00858 [Glarea lozoyensis ATCC 20868]|uniref:intramembrane prenyl-peptidase Rce1 n=1 Tax=Glarea lozoyensis (strain ATCC 20868 / MF5171) TaxID=1116229 RepID=S3DTF6_GLAL2|nr:uncharacterized protein GLAREA_00858 [Glarea lozoyensis ATCC 20868]EPE29698.1 hypothetical protein GLAREA_00858 [Glarea lozoyensis ATCC 20868]